MAQIDALSGPLTLSGVDAITSVNQLVAGPIGHIRLSLPGAGEPDHRTSLGAGIITGAGIWYEPAGTVSDPLPQAAPLAPAAPLPPTTTAEPSMQPPPSSGALAVAEIEAAEGDGGPLPRRPVRPSAEGADAAPDLSHVMGVLCPQGHFIDPRTAYCAVCGAPMVEQTAVAQAGVRPVLGCLRLDDGEVAPLEIGYVIGRDPKHDPDVMAGAARPLKITDNEGVVSRRHARIALVGWDVQVIDLGSANGTFIQPPGAAERQQLTPDTPVVIGPGTVITMGRRWLRFDPPNAA
jgi:hypothetical protein